MFEGEVNPEKIEKAELIVCISSYNEAHSISYPTAIASEGIVRYFPDKDAVIINCDNHSPDDTRQAFIETPTKAPKIYLPTAPGVKGKGNNFKNLFRKAVDLEAKAVVVVDADLQSITPEWIRHLGAPLFNGFAYVAPLYVRHKFDGTITNNIAYPLSRALYGRRVRQPMGGDFGFNQKLAGIYQKGESWDEAVANFGIDIWMTTLALNQDIQICQSSMGRPKIHRAKDPASSLGPRFRQVVGTIFSMMSRFASVWLRTKYSKPTAIFGFGPGEVETPPRVDVDTEELIHGFHEGFELYHDVWQTILTQDVYQKILEIRGLKEKVFTFPTDLWARTLYDVAVAYRDSLCEKDLMMDSLIPLYLGKTLAFVKKAKRMSILHAEEAVEEDCVTFEKTKPYLVQRWTEKPA